MTTPTISREAAQALIDAIEPLSDQQFDVLISFTMGRTGWKAWARNKRRARVMAWLRERAGGEA